MAFKDTEKGKTYYSKWQKDHPENNRIAQKKYWEKHPQRKLFKSSKANAKSRNLEHTITEEDIVIPEYCPYLKIKLTFKPESCNFPSTISLDRIDNSKGYIPGNVQVISRLANLMKSYATTEQLITFAESILTLHKDL